MDRWNPWIVWGLICALVQLAVISIAAGVAVHSTRFDGASVLMAVLITLGIQFIISAVAVLVTWD